MHTSFVPYLPCKNALGQGARDLSVLQAFETGGGGDEPNIIDDEAARSADGSRHGSGDFGSIGDRGSTGIAKKQTKSAAKDSRLSFLRCLLRLTSVALPNEAEGPFTLPMNHHNQVLPALWSCFGHI